MSTILTNELGPFTGTDIAIASGKTITGTASQFKITGGAAGQFMKTDGSGGLSFDTIAAASGVMKKIHYFEEYFTKWYCSFSPKRIRTKKEVDRI